MANGAQIPSKSSALIAMIADEDTITGFLLAGVGNVDLRRKTNYLIVDSICLIYFVEGSKSISPCNLANTEPVPRLDDRVHPTQTKLKPKDFVNETGPIYSTHIGFYPSIVMLRSVTWNGTAKETTVKAIEDAFKEFTTKEDIAIVLISQYVANMIRFLVDSYNKPVPAILEIPSKDHPYDPTHDSVLSRVKYLFSAESVASGRR
ncbi:hypothetical protein HHK36_012731 [Tetracentron sinense]|uniref:V-type proton ATPase subunit F n=1 Tax=Tetracentron sinense TaxID=13715 RepID=A0A834Z9S9_TETSI|nr:hypothetical protein HHK36_012731 [Tetracentron sinense]